MNTLEEAPYLSTIECGREAAKHFAFDKGYINLNHGESWPSHHVEFLLID